MAEFSKIAWTDATFNPWIGCTRVSPGCQNCYAENLMANRYKRVKWGPGQPRSLTKTWKDPIRWNAEAAKAGTRKKVFCASLADWLDHEVPARWLLDLVYLIDACDHLDWLMLTKRPENWRPLLTAIAPYHAVAAMWLAGHPPENVWFGVTAEKQEYWDLRVPIMATIPAAVRWVSYEPALGPLKLQAREKVDWLIIGGESDQATPARPFQIEWAHNAVIRCAKLGITPFVKQIGSNAIVGTSRLHTKDKAGADPAEWPPLLRVRKFPR